MTTDEPASPDPLREVPPADQFCDLVLNGGVASGVVYPWALLELARHYRFKSIGGNSVGAMAAAMAAAAEYGRCIGVEDAFEPLRRFPTELAKEDADGDTMMLRLFQPSPTVRRPFSVFRAFVRWGNVKAGDEKPGWAAKFREGLAIYGLWETLIVGWLGSVGVALAGWYFGGLQGGWVFWMALLGMGAAIVATLLIGARRVWSDLGAMAANNYGFCSGRGQRPGEEGLVEWLHKGIQRSAGRHREDPPLTFADLWAAPRFGRSGPQPLPDSQWQPPGASIDLQVFASNVTQGRPVRLPLCDANTRLFYLPEQWAAFFPPTVMKALDLASQPYAPASPRDPPVATTAATHASEHDRLTTTLRELPSAGMPLVVAARLSLCFPVLFTCVPVYAIDYEAVTKDRRLRRCLLSDGGLCTNFPVHLFDAAHPKWPTFAFLLDKRLQKFEREAIWLPEKHLEGRGDNWQRAVPGAELGAKPSLLQQWLGLAEGLLLTTKDWNDRVAGRLPQVRNRIIRLALQPGEGQLNIAMPRGTILRMAHVYGTRAGLRLVQRFAPDERGVKTGWREHLYVRSMIELRALRRHLRGYGEAVQAQGNTLPMSALLARACTEPPLALTKGRPDAAAARLTAAQCAALERAVAAVRALESELAACEGHFGPYQPVPEPELRLRPPL